MPTTVKPFVAVKAAFAPTNTGTTTAVVPETVTGVVDEAANTVKLAGSSAKVVKFACAGTTDKSPNPSEATATADTFFNEIVFTIFLSFSQIKDDLLPGW